MKTAMVCGAGGFIGGHLVRRLLDDGYDVVALDIKPFEQWYQVHQQFGVQNRGEFDVRDRGALLNLMTNYRPTEVYQLAADMGGAGYIFTGENDAQVMSNSAHININVAECVRLMGYPIRVFYSSSACIYPERNQMDPNNPNCTEESAYPAAPDSEYGWEKLFSERLWKSYERNYGISVRIARFHNIFGPEGTWKGGREKAPAAICRKVAEARSGDFVEVWGTGAQTRSFLYIDECVEAVRRLMESDSREIVNIGSEEMISINNLTHMVADISGKDIHIRNVDGPVGVNGRNSDNTLLGKEIGWVPSQPLRVGMEKTYNWIEKQLSNEF